MVNVLKDIKSAVREGAFKKEPKGPIGKHKHVLSNLYVVEQCMLII